MRLLRNGIDACQSLGWDLTQTGSPELRAEQKVAQRTSALRALGREVASPWGVLWCHFVAVWRVGMGWRAGAMGRAFSPCFGVMA